MPIAVRKSVMMDRLYGEKLSEKVYNRLEVLDPELNFEIQRIAYDRYWAKAGLSIRDKSLVTVVSLLSLKREEQTRIHINGFLNSGGSVDELLNIMLYFSSLGQEKSAKQGMANFIRVLLEREEKEDIERIRSKFSSDESEFFLRKRDLRIVHLAYCVALGDQKETEQIISKCLAGDAVSQMDIKNILIHQIVYCGFPAAMDGFSVLQKILLHEESF